jgi:hypothetical protein
MIVKIAEDSERKDTDQVYRYALLVLLSLSLVKSAHRSVASSNPRNFQFHILQQARELGSKVPFCNRRWLIERKMI